MNLVLRRASDMGFDRISEFQRALEWPFFPARLDHAGDAAGVTLFAEEAEDAGKVARLETVDDIGSTQARLRHAHVERSVAAEGKATLGLVELHGGNADVEHDAIGAFYLVVERREWRLHQLQPAAGLRLEVAPGRDRIWIAVDGNHGRARRQDGLGVAAGAERAVDHDVALRRR